MRRVGEQILETQVEVGDLEAAVSYPIADGKI